ncbi:hypothetical protein CVS40_3492, partial [Lucilia cuprina]
DNQRHNLVNIFPLLLLIIFYKSCKIVFNFHTSFQGVVV